MRTLSSSLLIEKNKLSSVNPWLILLEVTFPDATKLFLVKNTDDITFQNQLYTAFPFELDVISGDNKGEVPTVTLKVSNVTRAIQAYLEELEGMVGSEVTIKFVNYGYLSENFSDLEMTFDILSSKSDAFWVTFILGAPNPLRRRFPVLRYIAGHCAWEFKSRECNYVGDASFCGRSLDYCRLLDNSGRYGGFPGLNPTGVKIAP